jgi:hypothetical protein
VAYGGSDTERDTGFAKIVTIVFESLGVLNKGSAETAAAPDPDEPVATQAISSNSLNVTRVGGLAALITAVGAAALAVFNVDKTADEAPVVVAAYASVGVIVAAALLTAGIIVGADIRARKEIAAVTPPAGTDKTSTVSASDEAAEVKVLKGSAKGEMVLEKRFDLVLVNAAEGNVLLTLPSPAASPSQKMTLKRIDDNDNHSVTVGNVAGGPPRALTRNRRVIEIYSDGTSWNTF